MKSYLILCPLRLELEALLHSLQSQGIEIRSSKVGLLTVHEAPTLSWRFAVAGHGKVQFGVQTQHLLHHLNPIDAVICAGAAGSLSPLVAPLDIVVAEKTIEHDFKLKFIKRPDPQFPANPVLLEKFQGLSFKDFKIHFGAIASGDEDVIDAARAAELQTQTDALAVAWEGAGGARACHFNKIPFLEIRGVTDSANEQAVSDFQTHVKSVMNHIAQTLLSALR